jgi:hypothetical protein
MNDASELRALLAHHTGTTEWYSHSLVRTMRYTDGVRCFALHAGGGAYWLLDIIFTEPKIVRPMRSEGIVFIELEVKDGKALLMCKRDTDGPVYFKRRIELTDCPEGLWRFYFQEGVLMLPSEY